MFSVKLNKEYYAFDTGELYQLRRIYGNNTFSLDNELLDIYDIESAEDGVEITFVNKCPLLVDADDYNAKMNQSRFNMDWDLLRIFPINIDDYMMLEELANDQNKDNEETQKRNIVRNEIEKAREKVKLKH